MQTLDRTAWLRERQQGLGATDIASIVGVGFQDAAAVYEEKIAPEPIDREPSPIMEMGLATEVMNAGLFAKKTCAILDRAGLVRSPLHKFVGATLDFQVTNDALLATDRVSLAEPVDTKYVGPFFGDRWGDEGTDEVPDGYIVQVTWQVQALRDNGANINHGHISALSGAGDHRIYHIPFDPRLANMLFELGRDFWRRVVARQGIEGWSHPLQDEVANRLAELCPDVSVELDETAQAMVDGYQQCKEREKEAKREADEIKAMLLKELAGAGEGRLPDGQRVTQKIVHRKEYTVEATSYLDMRILKPRKVKV